jgi:hypothetical protein
MMPAVPAMMDAMPTMVTAVTAVTAVCLSKRRRDSDDCRQGHNRQDFFEHRVFSALIFCIGPSVADHLWVTYMNRGWMLGSG